MRNSCRRNIVWLYSCLLLFPALSRASAGEARVPVIMHVHSTVSGNGAMTLEEITALAREKGIRGIIFTDHDQMKWEYGLPPFRNLLKKTVEEGSVLRYGPEAYLSRIQELNRKYPGVVVIPGVESTPFYFWSGSPFRGNLTIHNANKHMIVAGLFDAEQYRRLPIVGNAKTAGRITLSLLAIPLAIFFFGTLFIYRHKFFGTLLILAGAALLANNYPFRALAYDPYHGDQRDLPYQQVIDYVNTVAPDTGIVFWAHPEAPNFERGEKIGPVSVSTPKYVNSLVATRGYTGFAYFWEGSKEAGKPGGTWDMLLTEYAAGKRDAPVWACGELDYRKEGLSSAYIDSIENIVLLDETQEVSAGNILSAIKRGHFYVASRPHGAAYDLQLDRFEIKTVERAAGMGERLTTGARPYAVLCDLRASDYGRHSVNVDVVRNGTITETYHLVSPFALNIPGPANGERAYYRLEITADNGSRLVTNPIIVE